MAGVVDGVFSVLDPVAASTVLDPAVCLMGGVDVATICEV